MRLAIVYDWLNVKVGGGEQLLFDVAKLYPEADIYALTYTKRLFTPYLAERKVRTSFLNRAPKFIKKHPELLLPLIPQAVESWDFSGYDVVLSISTAWAKNIRVPQGVPHICYCQSPARMIWDSWPAYLQGKKIGPMRVGPISRFMITVMASKIRLWDYYNTKGVSTLYANSSYIAGRIKKFYDREAKVLYPPVHALIAPANARKQNYYLVLSVLSKYKNIDLAIAACIELGRKLIVAGDGPDAERLKQLAGGSELVEFRGRVSDEQRGKLMAEARGFIFTSIEDFGMTPVEAMSVGTPVIALRGGGLVETVQEGVTGAFFDQPSATQLVQALEQFESTSWDEAKIRAQAEKFSAEQFEQKLQKIIREASHVE